MNRRHFLLSSSGVTVGAMALLAGAPAAFAADVLPLTQENWDQALASGRPIAVRFFETWCPNCTAQGKTLNALVNDNEKYADYVVLEAAFGANRDFAAQFGVRRRTSIAIIKDQEVVDFVTGETRSAGIANLLDLGL